MKFSNRLRIQIVPNRYADERIAAVAEYCKKYGFDDVMLFLNAEEYNVGHMTKEEAAPWVEIIKKAKKILNENGIGVSLNPWIELGHLARNRVLKQGQNFVTMEDCDGLKSDLVVCPLDENWWKYFSDFYTYLLKEIQPDVIWVEDDFRLHNHSPLRYGGCFCPLHIKRFNDYLGTNYSREEFVSKLFSGETDKKVQKAFLDVNGQIMSELAEKIGKLVKSLNLGTKVGLMSSLHTDHAMEGRRWAEVQNGLAQGGPKINRLHLPCYTEKSPKEYYYDFNYYTFLCRGFLDEDVSIYPELENGAFSTYVKDSEFLRFQVESALPVQIKGMTYDIYDFVGNGVIEKYGYGQKIKSVNDYMSAVISSGYGFYRLKGIVIPIDERNAYYRDIVKGDLLSLRPNDFAFATYLQTIGLSAKTEKKKYFHGEVIALGGHTVDYFTDEQLVALFENNVILLDGLAAKILIDKNLGRLIHASAYRYVPTESDLCAFEQAEKGKKIFGIENYRASAFEKAGDYVNITYDKEVEVLTRLYTNTEQEYGLGQTVSGNCYIFPFVFDKKRIEQFNPLRAELISGYVVGLKKEIVATEYSGVYAYLSQNGDERILILVNSTLNVFNRVTFVFNGLIENIAEIKRNGHRENIPFSFKDGRVVIKEKFPAIMTKTFVIR